MGVIIPTVLFLVLVLGWILLAFLPGLREIRFKRDIEALPVIRKSQVDIRFFAQGLREHLNSNYGELIANCRNSGKTLAGDLDENNHYVIVPNAKAELPLLVEEENYCYQMVISLSDLNLPDDYVHAVEIQADGNVSGGLRSVYRAILAGGSLHLAAGSASLRWLHAGTDLKADRGCLLHGRLSAEHTMQLGEGCRFERLNAPRLEFGNVEANVGMNIPKTASSDTPAVDPDQVPRLQETNGGRWLVDKEFELKAGSVLDTDLVVNGKVILGDGSLILGSIKSRGDMIVGAGVRVAGSLVSEKDMVLGEGSRVGGPIICEETLTLQRGCIVGDEKTPTTISSRRILIEPGVCCHGTVWAHEQGDVLVPQALALDAESNGGQLA